MVNINDHSSRRNRLKQRSSSPINNKNISCILFTVISVFYLFIISLYLHSNNNNSNTNTNELKDIREIEERINNENIIETTIKKKKVTVAYVISLVKCSDGQSSTAGLIDAALILRHSVHLTHVHSTNYDYKMYVISTSEALQCAHILEKLGYTILHRDPPIYPSEIKGEFLKKHIHKEWCCGSNEFIKLYAYTLTNHSIVVHTDMDFAFIQPMEEIFDSMLYDGSTAKGQNARKLLSVENKQSIMPNTIEAMFTKDYHQIIPGRKAGYQAGFIVLKPNVTVLDMYLDVIREGHYVEGYSRENGWGGKGYGVFVGAMAMQGLGAYFYDEIRPNTSVELNGCRYNFMAADILYRDIPAYYPNKRDLIGKCRNGREYDCEDCTITDMTKIKNIHYTNCRKPWNCAGEILNDKQKKTELGIDIRTTNVTTCHVIMNKWHSIRSDLEDLVVLNSDENNEQIIKMYERWRSGDYKTGVFQNHCKNHGQDGYNPIIINEDDGDGDHVLDLLSIALKKIYKTYY